MSKEYIKAPYRIDGASRDYPALFSRVMGGEAVPCWVDYKYRNDNKYSRDIAAIYKLDNGDIIIGARGIQYGYVDDWYTYDGMTAQEAFIIECERINLEY